MIRRHYKRNDEHALAKGALKRLKILKNLKRLKGAFE
jgi:hypothetical protein